MSASAPVLTAQERRWVDFIRRRWAKVAAERRARGQDKNYSLHETRRDAAGRVVLRAFSPGFNVWFGIRPTLRARPFAEIVGDPAGRPAGDGRERGL